MDFTRDLFRAIAPFLIRVCAARGLPKVKRVPDAEIHDRGSVRIGFFELFEVRGGPGTHRPSDYEGSFVNVRSPAQKDKGGAALASSAFTASRKRARSGVRRDSGWSLYNREVLPAFAIELPSSR